MTKRLRAKDLREVPGTELQERLRQLQKELWQHRLKSVDGSLQQTHVIRTAKRDVARIQTMLTEQARQTTTRPQA